MRRPSRPRKLGASILIGIAAGTIPLSGCEVIGYPPPVEQTSPEEQRLFQAATTQNDPVLVERYLRRHPDGRVQSVLAAQSAEVLSRLAPNAFANVSSAQLSALPPSIKPCT